MSNEAIVSLIIGILLGGLISWMITAYYYKRGSKERPSWANGLRDEVISEFSKRYPDADPGYLAEIFENALSKKIRPKPAKMISGPIQLWQRIDGVDGFRLVVPWSNRGETTTGNHRVGAFLGDVPSGAPWPTFSDVMDGAPMLNVPIEPGTEIFSAIDISVPQLTQATFSERDFYLYSRIEYSAGDDWQYAERCLKLNVTDQGRGDYSIDFVPGGQQNGSGAI